FFCYLLRPPPTSTLFPYTTLFRSHLVVNEVDYDNVGTDDREFVEVFNGTNAAADLTNIAVVLVNGADNNEYSRVALAGSLAPAQDRKSTRLNSSHDQISYAVFCLK